MTLGKYALLAQRTARKEPNVDHLLNGIMGLIGETGEVVDTLKKWHFQSENNTPLPVCKIIEELGDVLWYVVEFAKSINIPMNDLPIRDPVQEIDGIIPCALSLAQSAILCAVDGEGTSKADIVELIAKISWIAEEYCTVSLSEVMNVNINKLMKRYPEGFSVERSTNRDDC